MTLEFLHFLQTTSIAIPLFQVGLLLLLSTLSLLFGWVRLALLINLTFTLYWGYLANRAQLGPAIEKMGYSFIALYFGFGIAIIVLALIGFFSHQD